MQGPPELEPLRTRIYIDGLQPLLRLPEGNRLQMAKCFVTCNFLPFADSATFAPRSPFLQQTSRHGHHRHPLWHH